jgi:hypothetical protein
MILKVESGNIDMTVLLIRSYEMAGQHILTIFIACARSKNCVSTEPHIGESLKSEGRHLRFRKLESKTNNYVQGAHTVKYKKHNILIIP